MSPSKSQGQEIALGLDRAQKSVAGRAVDVEWWHQSWAARAEVTDPPPELIEQLVPGHRERIGEESWVAWEAELAGAPEPETPVETRGLLDHFLALENGTPEDVKRFILSFGALGLCVHLRAHRTCTPLLTEGEHGSERRWEAPTAYRDHAQVFRKILTLAKELQENEAPHLELWADVMPFVPEYGTESNPMWGEQDLASLMETAHGVFSSIKRPDERPIPTRVGSQNRARPAQPVDAEPRTTRQVRMGWARIIIEAGGGPDLLGRAIHGLMQESPVTLGFDWRGADDGSYGPARDRLVGDTFGILVYQLSTAVQGGTFAICMNCGRGYIPKRKPQAGRDNYCEECVDARKSAYKRRKPPGGRSDGAQN